MLRRTACLAAVAVGGLVPLGARGAQMQEATARVVEGTPAVQVAILSVPGATVRWGTVDGSAVAGTDYAPSGGTIAFGPGQRSAIVTVPVVDDDAVEGPEAFGVAILEVTTDGVQVPTLTTVAVADDDFLPGRCANPVAGTAAGEALGGGPAGDRITGGGGDDVITTLAGDDCAGGGTGADRIALGPGADTGDGGTGADLVAGGTGNDRLAGGPGPDDLRGGTGGDRITARDGVRDRVDCGPGRDVAILDRRDAAAGCEVVRRG
jgi:Ca2+-binding RTX toxin-like protein